MSLHVNICVVVGEMLSVKMLELSSGSMDVLYRSATFLAEVVHDPELRSEICLKVIGVELEIFSGSPCGREFAANMLCFGLLFSQSALESRIFLFVPLKILLHSLIGHVCLVLVVDATIHASVISFEA